MTDASRCESLIQDLCETLGLGNLICNNLLTGICDDFVNICDAEEFDERNSLELPASGLINRFLYKIKIFELKIWSSIVQCANGHCRPLVKLENFGFIISVISCQLISIKVVLWAKTIKGNRFETRLLYCDYVFI